MANLNAYQAALVGMAAACAGVRNAAVRLQAAAQTADDDSGAAMAVEACRASLLDALAVAPELRDLFVVPALPARR